MADNREYAAYKRRLARILVLYIVALCGKLESDPDF